MLRYSLRLGKQMKFSNTFPPSASWPSPKTNLDAGSTVPYEALSRTAVSLKFMRPKTSLGADDILGNEAVKFAVFEGI